MLTIPTIAKYLSLFRYLTCGMKLEIEVVSTQLQYGVLMVSALPYTDNIRWLSKVQQSQAQAVLLDISQQTSLEMSLPYLRPKIYHDLRAAEPDDQSWRVAINPLYMNAATMDSPVTAVVNVFCSFTDVTTAGYLPTAIMQSGSHPNIWVRAARLAGVTGEVPPAVMSLIRAAGYTGSEDVSSVVSEATSRLKGLGLGEGSMSVPDNAKLSLVGEISAPAVPETQTTNRLGDCTRPKHEFLPADHDVSFHHLAHTPVLSDELVFTDPSQSLIVDASPFPPFSHSLYLKRMFKYWRGGSNVMLRFVTSPLISARFKITVFTAGMGTTDNSAIGDVISWILSVKGSEEVSFNVPYLQSRAWQAEGDADYVSPKVYVQLLDPLPQPFDKPAAVYLVVFRNASSDLKFAGLQSCVGGPAIMQSIAGSLDRAVSLGRRVTNSYPYQGSIDNVYSVLGRFSTREPVLDNEFPFPVEIDTWSHLYTLDNFDYLSNLFKFYTGDTALKIVFSKAPADGIIQSTIGNTRVLPSGDSFKAGNGVVLSHQAVWPVLDMIFPYMCEDEFNSPFDPAAMYIPRISDGATIGKFLISMTDTFRLFHLLPVPDFFLTSEPAEISAAAESTEVATLQSVSRIAGTYCYTGKLDILTGESSSSVTIADNSLLNGKLINAKVWVFQEFDLDLNTGTNLFCASITPEAKSGLCPATSNDNMASLLLGDFNAVSYSGHSEFAWSSFLSDELHLNIQAINSPSDRDCHFGFVVHLCPFGSASVLTNANNQDAEGFVSIENSIPIVVSLDDVADVFVTNTGADAVPVTNEDSSPLFVTVDNDPDHPVPVGLVDSDTITVLVVNPADDPVPVSFSTSDPITVTGRVQGIPNPDTPVFVSSYFS